MSKNKLKRILIKLGTACNLHCKYCHSGNMNYVFNPEILPVLKEMKLQRIAFSGGEPLLYWDTICKIVEYIGDETEYKIVTNGTLFTKEIVDFCNQHRFKFFISLDGENSTRDLSKPIQWDLIKQLRQCGTAVTFYRENQDIRKTLNSLNLVKEKYLTISDWMWSSYPNFVHSTEKTGALSDRALADSYVSQMTELAEEAFKLHKEGKTVGFLGRLFIDYVKLSRANGVRCCSDMYISILADGTICSCPYTLDKVGDIFHLDEIDWDEIKEKYCRESCKTCELFDVCKNYCLANITDDECYIMKKMHKNMVKLMEKYNISYEEFDEIFPY